ncbi:MAG: hypothetical protein KC910_23365 [Candidatus Eremiobacteraeota bacterium]|nr:hypothetical protein [Candidatus Eremiobacteraeota bacterium]
MRALILFLLLSACCLAQTPYPFTSVDDTCQVVFPMRPALEAFGAKAGDGNTTYNMSDFQYARSPAPPPPQEYKGQVREFEFQGYPAVEERLGPELSFNGHRSVRRLQVVVGRIRRITLEATWTGSQEPPEVAGFFESLKILSAAAEPSKLHPARLECKGNLYRMGYDLLEWKYTHQSRVPADLKTIFSKKVPRCPNGAAYRYKLNQDNTFELRCPARDHPTFDSETGMHP